MSNDFDKNTYIGEGGAVKEEREPESLPPPWNDILDIHVFLLRHIPVEDGEGRA